MVRLPLRSGSWAGGARGGVLNWELLVFLKENIGFSKAGELSGGPGREGWAPSGALGDVSGRSLGAVGRVLGVPESVGGAPRELRGSFLELLGAHFDALGTSWGDFGLGFLGS